MGEYNRKFFTSERLQTEIQKKNYPIITSLKTSNEVKYRKNQRITRYPEKKQNKNLVTKAGAVARYSHEYLVTSLYSLNS